MPYLSVVMPAYNSEKTIEASIQSVLGQTFQDFELIVIDDCSKDRTNSIANEMAKLDDRICVIKNEKNSGVSFSRNRGIALAKGTWIAFLDSDDLWRGDKLEKQLALLEENENAVICYTASAFFDDKGNKYDYIMQAESRTTFQVLLKRNLLSCSSVVVKASVMKSFPMPCGFIHEDYYAWLHIVNMYQVAYGINEPLLLYRLSSESKSGNRIHSAQMLFNSYRVYGYCRFTSFLLMLQYSIHSISKRKKIKKSCVKG